MKLIAGCKLGNDPAEPGRPQQREPDNQFKRLWWWKPHNQEPEQDALPHNPNKEVHWARTPSGNL